MDPVAKKAWGGVIRLGIILATLLFLPAWSPAFWQAWIFFILFMSLTSFVAAFIARHDRELLESRLRAGPGAEKIKTQQVIQLFASGFIFLLVILPGFDFRLHWSSVPTAAVFCGDLLVATGYWLAFLALRENSFASGTIKVRNGQRVVISGPYAAVRHPMYTGAILMFIGTPLALGSWWTFTAAVPLVPVIILRLLEEERLLEGELFGYAGYCTSVRYRLFPWIW
ncbi:MAG: isoprenylcysteine carboxylmethyltransferase family protein [Ignavibacteriales bacterium]|nr:isoprenylcysteine carboxylmethyltransferase family protein [Ignavibacteriales bacterium]